VSSFCNSAGFIAPTLLLAFFYSNDDVGYFSLAQKITSIPSVAIGGAISQAYMSQATIFIREDPQKIKALHHKTTILLMGITLSISAVLYFSPYLFSIFFGSEWLKAGEMTRYMTFVFATSTVMSSISLLDWLHKQDWMLIWNVVRLVLICLVFMISNYARLSANEAIGLFAVTVCLMYLVLYPMNIKAINLVVSNSK
jgi:O-antigen/teichoic acid export membrane protein